MTTTSSDHVYFLLVDDLEENLLALEGLLRRDGLTLLKAKSGTAALEVLLKYEVALALVDIQMPGMDGFEFVDMRQVLSISCSSRLNPIFCAAKPTSFSNFTVNARK
jgi:CheY-like chemotaxis protein